MFRRTRRALLCLTLSLAGTLSAGAQVLTQDANHRYIDVNGTAKMLIGMSSEYLPHIVRTGKNSIYCTYGTYQTCINTLNSYGLNKLQVWAMMNNSVGLSDLNPGAGSTSCAGTPSLNRSGWVNDQPFLFRTADNIWDLDSQNSTFFTQLNNVIAYAATKNVIVEVTLFDPYSGDQCTSPWVSVNNIATLDGTHPQFTARRYFTTFDNNSVNATDCALSDTNLSNRAARQRQMTAIQWMVQNLNGNTNFYWNIANEPDESPNATFTTSSTALINWHNCVASKIVQFEQPLPNKHLIGANFWTDSALNTFAASGNANIKIINGHYNKIQCTQNNQVNCPVVHGAKTFLGAIPLLNTYWSTLPNTTFGFNETKSSPVPSVAAARAEAWEFAMAEGAAYDQYNLDRQDSRTVKVLGYLNFLQQFLSPFTLTNFGRSGGTGIPGFVTSGLPAYPTATQYAGLDGAGLGNTYWSAMQWTRNQYGLYLHHSSIPDPNGTVEFKSYAPCYKSAGYQNTFTFALGSLAGWYKVEWFKPGEAAPGTAIAPVCTDNVNWSGSGSTPALTSPKYPYDLAVRIQRCPNGVGPCATAVSCSGIAVGALPPDDDRREASCSVGSPNP